MIIDCTLPYKILAIIYERATEIYSFYHIDDILHPPKGKYSFIRHVPTKSFSFYLSQGTVGCRTERQGQCFAKTHSQSRVCLALFCGESRYMHHFCAFWWDFHRKRDISSYFFSPMTYVRHQAKGKQFDTFMWCENMVFVVSKEIL